MKFEIRDRDAAGRICRLTTKHGVVTTPNLMPVINPNKLLIPPKEMKKLFGTDIVITNSYIIKQSKELKNVALDKGVHKLIDFNGTIMTDSGTFQSYVYGDIDVDPLEIVEFQREMGSDIGTILDVFGPPDQSKKEAEHSIRETLKRAKESIKLKGDMLLACTIQGSVYPDLREKSARNLSRINADFFAIGGVVPLMENQRYLDLVRIILSSKKGLDPSKPVHLFGAGHPVIFPLAVALGCDFFDSSAYAKYANDERMIFPWGTEKLEDLIEFPCSCPVCSEYNISEFKTLEKKERILEIAKHNLYISYAEIKKIRNAIHQGSLWEMVERRANSNPFLLDALKLLRLEKNKIWLEKFEPISKNKALFYTGSHTIHRPIVYRVHKRLLERYKFRSDDIIVFPEGDKPYSVFYSKEIKKILDKNDTITIVIDSSLGPVPIELDEMYPFAQSVFPYITDAETEEKITEMFDVFVHSKNVICWDGDETLEEIKTTSYRGDNNLDIVRISAVSDVQFGRNASKALLDGEIKIIKSKKTGKIRNVYCRGKHVLSMRASDGLFTLKIDGGKVLHKFFRYPKLRVVIHSDAVPFVREGKSVFARFVKDCDPELRPFDECLVVDEQDTLLAVGKVLLSREEMLSFQSGVAVKTREHI